MILHLKKTVFVILLMTYSSLFYAQNTERIHEIGLSTSGLLDFGFSYKTGQPNHLFRAQALFLGGDYKNIYDQQSPNQINIENVFGVGFQLGYEQRVKLIENFSFVCGVDLGSTYHYYKQDLTYATNYNTYIIRQQISPRIYAVIGVNYVLKDKISFSLNVFPHIGLNYSINEEKVNTGTNYYERNIHAVGFVYGINISNVQFTVAYRFATPKKEKTKTPKSS